MEENRSTPRLNRVGQQCLFAPTAGFLFSPPQTQVLSQAQSPRGGLQRTSIDDARAAFGKLAFAPLRKSRQEVFARKQLEDGISKKLEPLIVPGKQGGDCFFSPCRAQFGHC